MQIPSIHGSLRRAPGLAICGLLLGGGVTACAEGSLQPERSASVSLSVSASAEGGAPGATSGVVSFADGHHTLTLERVRLVVGGVTLREDGAAACQTTPPFGAGCEVLERGLVLLEAPLDGSLRSVVASLVRPARYDALGLRLHAPRRGVPDDSVFLDIHGSFEGISVRVEGLWDGEPFLFERPLDEERWIDVNALSVESGRTVNVTLRLDPSTWFRSDDGRLIDPRVAALDPVTGAAVEARIRTSIAAFEDENVDGIADSR